MTRPVGPSPHTIRLRSVTPNEVAFWVVSDDGIGRLATVCVSTGGAWRDAVRFPHDRADSGASTGDSALDAELSERAAEELVRLAAARAEAA